MQRSQNIHLTILNIVGRQPLAVLMDTEAAKLIEKFHTKLTCRAIYKNRNACLSFTWNFRVLMAIGIVLDLTARNPDGLRSLHHGPEQQDFPRELITSLFFGK